jgi:hypothetical protein
MNKIAAPRLIINIAALAQYLFYMIYLGNRRESEIFEKPSR